MTNISLPESGEIRVNLACVCNVNHGATSSVVTTANIGPSAHIESLARRSVTGLERCVRRRYHIRNSLHHSVTCSVGELVSVNYCHNIHREGKLPMENRHSGAGTHAHGNPHGAVTGGGGWKKREAVTTPGNNGGIVHHHHRHGRVRGNTTRVRSAFGGAVIAVSSARNGTIS